MTERIKDEVETFIFIEHVYKGNILKGRKYNFLVISVKSKEK